MELHCGTPPQSTVSWSPDDSYISDVLTTPVTRVYRTHAIARDFMRRSERHAADLERANETLNAMLNSTEDVIEHLSKATSGSAGVFVPSNVTVPYDRTFITSLVLPSSSLLATRKPVRRRGRTLIDGEPPPKMRLQALLEEQRKGQTAAPDEECEYRAMLSKVDRYHTLVGDIMNRAASRFR
eukprot:Sspe_Gene.80864::Locus_51320_Transcript_1_1_Confidence_1.000_Length_767::g.80864::m.80864